MDSEYKNAEIMALKLLKNKIFSGSYTERRLIEVGPLSMYKDVIIVDKSERDFMDVLRKVNKSLKKECRSLLTTCISESASQCALWTSLNGVLFGPHWFQIRNLTISQNVVNIHLQFLRSIEPEQIAPSQPIFDWNSFRINSNIGSVITKENLVLSLRFTLVVLLAIAMGFYQLLLLLVQLLHELNYLIRSMIPFLIVCVENLNKAFGGLLILVAMMWRTRKTNTTSTRRPNFSREVVPTMPYARRPVPHTSQYSPYTYNSPNRVNYDNENSPSGPVQY